MTCISCLSGKKTKSVISHGSDQSIIGVSRLSAANVGQLPSNKEVRPEDSITQVGVKRTSSQAAAE